MKKYKKKSLRKRGPKKLRARSYKHMRWVNSFGLFVWNLEVTGALKR